jgi:excisionase family DNA binding protein
MEELVKISDAAARLGIHYQTLRRWVRDGRGPRCVLTPGNRMCFRESDLRDWTNGLGTYEPVTAGPCNHPRKNPLSR